MTLLDIDNLTKSYKSFTLGPVDLMIGDEARIRYRLQELLKHLTHAHVFGHRTAAALD